MDIRDIKEGRDYERHPQDASLIVAENISLDQAAFLYLYEQPKGLILKRGLQDKLSEVFATHVQPDYPYCDLLKKNDKSSRSFKMEFGAEGLTEVRGVIHFDTYKDRFEKTLPAHVMQDLVELAGVSRRVNVGGPVVNGLYLHDEHNKGPSDILTNRWHTHPGTTINIAYEGVGLEMLLGWEPNDETCKSLREYSDEELATGGSGCAHMFQAAVGDPVFIGPKLIHRGPHNLPESGRMGFALYY